MTLEKALYALLEHIEYSDKPIVVNWDTVQQWSKGVLEKLEKSGLLIPASSAQILECDGCENRCFMDVSTHTYNEKIRAFIACDDAVMQSQMGRIEISLERLKQWRSSANQLASFIHGLLAMQSDINITNESEVRLGMIKGKGGRCWVSLLNNPLVVLINGYKAPVSELLFVDDGELVIDRLRIDELVNRKPLNVEKTYESSTDNREARKLTTQTKYQDWQDAYESLKIKYLSKSKTWYSLQISKMPIAQGADSETIRRKLK